MLEEGHVGVAIAVTELQFWHLPSFVLQFKSCSALTNAGDLKRGYAWRDSP